MLHLTESDLRFLVETVATSRRDYDHLVNVIRDKEDLLEPMLEDPKLTERLFRDEEALVRISPHLLFSVLLRRLRKELETEAYILDVDIKGKRIPVFEGPAVAEMLSDKQTRDYLAEMLSSFARTNSGIISRTVFPIPDRGLGMLKSIRLTTTRIAELSRTCSVWTE